MNIIANLHCRMMTNVVEHNFRNFLLFKKLKLDLTNKHSLVRKDRNGENEDDNIKRSSKDRS